MWELGPDADEPEWQTVETPFDTDLFEVVNTTEGPYAVGDGGVLAANRGDGWEIVTDAGPNASQNQLRSLAVTDDGKRLWFLGSSGALGCYDVETRRKSDYSFPMEKTSTWESIAVSGAAGSEKVLAGNGSGEILPFTIDGFDVNWNVIAKPDKQGATMTDLAADAEGYGYGIDTSGNVFTTTRDNGWERVGINNAQEKFYDIWGGQHGRIYVTAGSGRLYRYDDSYQDWTPVQVAEQGALQAFDMYDNQMVVLGDSGLIYQRMDGGERWEKVPTRTEDTLNDLALGKPDIAVGTDGTVLRRPRGTTRHSGKSPDEDNFDGRGEIYDPDQNAPGESGSSQSQNQNQEQGQNQNKNQDQNQNQSQGQSQPQQNQDQADSLNQGQNQNQGQSQDQSQKQSQEHNQTRPQNQDPNQPQQDQSQSQPQQNQDQADSPDQGQNQSQAQNQNPSQRQSQPQEQNQTRTQNQPQSQPQQIQDLNQPQQNQSQSQPQQVQDLDPTQQNQNQSQDATVPSSRAKPQGQDQPQGQNQAQPRNQDQEQDQDQNLLSGIKDKIEQLSDGSQDSEADQGQSP
jgi:photosystem II stability/assembly factor-like uncharacterized protein